MLTSTASSSGIGPRNGAANAGNGDQPV
jgi:hypothetical protein